MRDMAIVRGGFAAALSVAAAACTPALQSASDYGAKPLAEMGDPGVPVDSVYYQGAVTAIEHRDYATALDYLQEARERAPNSARVLNAFGVVYDKLGRFDLSARYYAQASALDPGSPTIARNIAYSRLLQGMVDGTQVASASPPMPGAPPVSAPTIPVVAQALPASLPASGIVDAPPPQTLLAATHVAPSVAPPQHVAAAFDVPAVSFTKVDIVLPDEPAVEQSAAPAVAADAHIAPRVAAPARLAPIGANPLAALGPVNVAFDDARPGADAVALQPLPVAPGALPNSVAVTPNERLLPVVGRSPVAFPRARIALSDLPPISTPSAGAVHPSPALHASTSAPVNGLTMASLALAAVAQTNGSVFHAEAVTPAPLKHPVTSGPAYVVGRPLRIINASGHAGTTDPINRSLAALGWSVSKTRPVAPASVKLTTVVYPIANAPVARALARTLPFPVNMQPDTSGERGIRLVVGMDFLNFNPGGRHVPGLWRTNLAALGTNKGVQ